MAARSVAACADGWNALADAAAQNRNDRTATGSVLDVVVANPVQLIELRKAMPANYENAVFVESDIAEGMIILRSFVPDPSWRQIAERHLAAARCETGAG